MQRVAGLRGPFHRPSPRPDGITRTALRWSRSRLCKSRHILCTPRIFNRMPRPFEASPRKLLATGSCASRIVEWERHIMRTPLAALAAAAIVIGTNAEAQVVRESPIAGTEFVVGDPYPGNNA